MPTIHPVFSAKASQPVVQPANATDRLEAMFLEQMLDGIGLKAPERTFSGGAGEQQFQSFLNQQYAGILAEAIDLKLGMDTK